jgi:hypothetical protein
MVAWLEGKKTILGLLALGIIGVLVNAGVIADDATVKAIVAGIFALTGVAGVAHVNRVTGYKK